MLTEWCLGGFKSFAQETTLNLRPITVFAGANSSGKSSLLHSMLLLKQTIQYGPPNRPLSLNGRLLRLGTLEEVIHTGLTNRELSIGFTFSFNESQSTERVPRAPWLNALGRTYSLQSPIHQIEGKLNWASQEIEDFEAPEAQPGRLQPSLTLGELRIRHFGEMLEHFVKYSRATSVDDSTSGSGPNFYAVTMDEESTEETKSDLPECDIVGMQLNYFLPNPIIVKYNSTKKRVQQFVKSLFRTSPVLTRARPQYDPETLSTGVLKAINRWLETHSQVSLVADDDGGIATSKVKEVLSRVRRRASSGTLLRAGSVSMTAIDELDAHIMHALLKELPAEYVNDFGFPRSAGAAGEFLRTFFQFGVRYLGPLRFEPRPVYEWSAYDSTSDVGYRGEQTAAVLYANQNVSITYVPSQSFTETAGRDLKPIRATLRAAVIDWLQYMGIAVSVSAHEAGVYGNTLRVRTEDDLHYHDLTNVGVGVSQVLPIVVSALLAPRSSLLIFEQPELHLHPKVQARLADFFLAMASSGKQCILETHSEYLIERLRLRIAEHPDDNYKDNVALYFTSRANGETTCKAIDVSRYGAITEWPEDFFDQTQIEASAILRAAAEKRARERENPN